MGINIDKTITKTFVIGGALGGAAGFLFGTAFVFSNIMGFLPGVKAFAAAVLGGIGNIRGAMIGGLLLGIIEVLIPALAVHRHQVDRRRRVRRAGPGAGLPTHRHPRREAREGGMKTSVLQPAGQAAHRVSGARPGAGHHGRPAAGHPAGLRSRLPGGGVRARGCSSSWASASSSSSWSPSGRGSPRTSSDPGVFPLAVGGITVVAAQTLLKWHDPTGDGKFRTVAAAAGDIAGLAPLAAVFFGWLAWTLLVVTVLVAGAGIVLGPHRSSAGWRPGWPSFGVFIVLVVARRVRGHLDPASTTRWAPAPRSSATW